MKLSLYEAVGGLPTLEKVHKIFYDEIYAHPWLKQFFAGHNQQAIEDRQTSFMGEKMGGPKYLGKPIKQVHENMYITQELYELRHEILNNALHKAGVSEELVERFHDRDAAISARENFIARFQQGAMPDDMPEHELHTDGPAIPVANLLKEAGLVKSTSEALRMIKQGAVKIDGEKQTDTKLEIQPGTQHVYQVGKRRFARITIH